MWCSSGASASETSFARAALIANLSDQKKAARFITTEKITKNQSAAPPIAQPTPMNRAVSPARRTQVRALVLKLAWLRFTALLSADTGLSVEGFSRQVPAWPTRPGLTRDRSDERRPFGDSALRWNQGTKGTRRRRRRLIPIASNRTS